MDAEGWPARLAKMPSYSFRKRRDPVSKGKVGVMEGAQHGLCLHMCAHTHHRRQKQRDQTNSFLKQSIMGKLVVDKRDLKAGAVTVNTGAKMSVQ